MATRLVVNGRRVEVAASPNTPLLWALRDEVGCSSVKYGCGLEQCGACRVLVDGVPRASCRVAIGDAADQQIETLEALVSEPEGQRVISGLIARNAGQCGYCLPGIAVTLTHLARQQSRHPRPVSRSDIVRVLDDHLCRCGSQPRIIAAAVDILGTPP